MNLLGKRIIQGDTIYSESMGYGRVVSTSGNSIIVEHHGQNWRYNSRLVRQGCFKCDVGWHPRLQGVQIKSKTEHKKAQSIVSAVAVELTKVYG